MTSPELGERRVKAWELYRIRRLELAAERKALEAQLTHNQARALLLELELKYGFLASDATLDIHTGRIMPCPERRGERCPEPVEGPAEGGGK